MSLEGMYIVGNVIGDILMVCIVVVCLVCVVV